MHPLRRYIRGVLRWATQSINVFFWPILNLIFHTDKFGDEDEYTSSVLGKLVLEKNNRAIWVCKLLSKILFDENHCVKSIEKDEGK